MIGRIIYFSHEDEKDEIFDDLPGLDLKIDIEYEDAIPFW